MQRNVWRVSIDVDWPFFLLVYCNRWESGGEEELMIIVVNARLSGEGYGVMVVVRG